MLDFATLATPLTDLTMGSQPRKVQWSVECEKAFQDLKHQLTKELVLFHPDFAKPFVLQTDVSNVGLGAVLSQEVNEN